VHETQLPSQFRELEAFRGWALETERERSIKRHSSSMAETRAFYDAILARLDEILKLLADYSLADAPPEVRLLFLMTLSLAEVAPAVENFGQTGVVDGYDYSRFLPSEDQ
jgi:hypothetical protein